MQLSYLGTSLCIPSSYHVAAWLLNKHHSGLSGLHHLRNVYQRAGSFIFGNGLSPTVPGTDWTEYARRCPNGIANEARLVSAGQYADVHCCATEQLHARACRFGNITLDLVGLQKKNYTSNLTDGGILNRHSHGHNYVCTYQVTRSDIQLQGAILNITLNTRTQWSAATKQVRGLYAQTFFIFWMDFVNIINKLL